jgi:NitT/TauT family transport system permease protein
MATSGRAGFARSAVYIGDRECRTSGEIPLSVAVRQRVVDWGPPLVVFALGILAWQFLVVAFNVQEFLLPRPTEIAQTLWDERSSLWHAGIYTFKEALGGFAIGSSLGILVALVFAAFRPVGTAFMPFAVAANAVPIIAFAPIMNNWFGLLNPFSKMAIAAVLCFFPVQINMLRGLSSVDPRAIELMRSYAAGKTSTFRHVRIPASLPHLFAGLKIASVLSMIGAIVGEYFGGPTTALGVTILNASAYTNFSLAWAGIVLASAFGILFYGAVALAERLTIPWDPSRRAFQGD